MSGTTKFSSDRAELFMSLLRLLGSVFLVTLPFVASMLVWGSTVNERVAKHDEKIAVIERDNDRQDKMAERDRAEIIARLNHISDQIETLQREMPRGVSTK